MSPASHPDGRPVSVIIDLIFVCSKLPRIRKCLADTYEQVVEMSKASHEVYPHRGKKRELCVLN